LQAWKKVFKPKTENVFHTTHAIVSVLFVGESLADVCEALHREHLCNVSVSQSVAGGKRCSNLKLKTFFTPHAIVPVLFVGENLADVCEALHCEHLCNVSVSQSVAGV
jgi:hypothetical protein